MQDGNGYDISGPEIETDCYEHHGDRKNDLVQHEHPRAGRGLDQKRYEVSGQQGNDDQRLRSMVNRYEHAKGDGHDVQDKGNAKRYQVIEHMRGK